MVVLKYILYLFLQYASIVEPDNVFPPHKSTFLPLLPLAHAVRQALVTAVMSSQVLSK